MEGPLLGIRISESRLLAGALVPLHALAAAAPALADLPSPVRTGIMFACGASLMHALWSARRHRRGGAVLLEFRSGQWWVGGQPAALDRSSSVLPGMMILCLRAAASMHVLRVMADSADPQTRRRLRVLLRYGTSTVSPAHSDNSG